MIAKGNGTNAPPGTYVPFKAFVSCLPPQGHLDLAPTVLGAFFMPIYRATGMRVPQGLHVARCLCALAFLSLSTLLASEELYWKEFVEARGAGHVCNLNAYVGFLATPSATETPDSLRQRKDALTYFIATGGKHGFSDKPATPEEVEDLHKAFTFVALMQEGADPGSPLNLMDVRRRFGRLDENERVRTHLRLAQEWITSSRMRIGQCSGAGSLRLEGLFHKEYMPAMGALYGYPSAQDAWGEYRARLKASLTLSQAQRLHALAQGLSTMEGKGKGANHLSPVFAYVRAALPSQESMASLQRRLEESCKPILYYLLDNGVTVIRKGVGSFTLDPPGELYHLWTPPLPREFLVHAQNEEAFRAALAPWSAIRSVFYV